MKMILLRIKITSKVEVVMNRKMRNMKIMQMSQILYLEGVRKNRKSPLQDMIMSALVEEIKDMVRKHLRQSISLNIGNRRDQCLF